MESYNSVVTSKVSVPFEKPAQLMQIILWKYGNNEDVFLDRDIWVTPFRGAYEKPGGFVITVNGSPTRSCIIVPSEESAYYYQDGKMKPVQQSFLRFIQEFIYACNLTIDPPYIAFEGKFCRPNTCMPKYSFDPIATLLGDMVYTIQRSKEDVRKSVALVGGPWDGSFILIPEKHKAVVYITEKDVCGCIPKEGTKYDEYAFDGDNFVYDPQPKEMS